MQTLTEQLVEALEDAALVAHVNTCYRTGGTGQEFPKCTNPSCVKCRRALDRARADPEALLRENGEAVRRLGNELMQGARERQWAMTREGHGPLGFPDLSCCWSSRKGAG